MQNFHKPNIVISNCIEHEACRYDGSMIKNSFIEKLKSHVNFSTVCPEVGIGLPIPRDTLRVVNIDDIEKIVISKTGEDVTEKMKQFSDDFINNLNNDEIDGFILKGKSPSCGIKDVKVYTSTEKGPALPKKSSGIFANIALDKYPNILVENEGRLTNYNIREHFLTRIFTQAMFREIKKKKSMKDLIDFHSNNKYLLMAYSPGNLKTLGKLVANNDKNEIGQILREYEFYLNKALSMVLKPMRNVNMLLHLFGYFSKELSSNEKAFFLDKLEKYSAKQVPLSVPVAIINSWVMRFNNEYLANQTIFEPFPSELIEVTDSGKGL
ncbi:Uncharacterized conserved protein YbgA, DUF1722 family [Desulfonispora thiosulfatigenes DSM 11270]|uniref:Uncharacterized conserved protein YbgA, DUF1722 family n=1 Tax=Desulfonispora thiosulfatigenes DSM 11270 TaxID=656914 RepID=A0A1W1VHV7_DESTI|nr:DUF1722 domain-containing protein [Desulfonispora thiosulfatigenes]SMB92544.1 Uncharacterized conserved protein YbgA, DUF1722 family [Desulfonispora thiosulfatigenes DSM 11270]